MDATEIAVGNLPVSLARLVHINALACDIGKTVDYRVRMHEARLLTSYLTSTKLGTPINVDYSAFTSSSSHIRRFISECAGLGILTASCESLFSWKPGNGALHSFDVLPAFLKPTYGGLGVRPDLLFHLPSGPMAGEARGRHRAAKTLFPRDPTSDQKKRLLELADWSAQATDHPYFMSWVWVSRTGVGVDIFLHAHGQWDADLDLASWDHAPGAEHWSIEPPQRVARGEPSALSQSSVGAVPFERPASAIGDWFTSSAMAHVVDDPLAEWRNEGRSTIQAAAARAVEEAERVADRLLETAPPRIDTLGDVGVRGDWVRADALGLPQWEVLVGVLERRAHERPASRRYLPDPALAQEGVDVHFDGRLLTIVKPLAVERPSFRRLEAMFE